MKSMWANWVLDVTHGHEPMAFCPIEDDGTIITGMTMISGKCPGRLVGVVHFDGDGAVIEWLAKHSNVVDELAAANGAPTNLAGEMFYTCDACHNKQDGRLSFCEECGYDTLTKKPTPLAVAGEPVGYADGSRFHELREGRLNLALWAEESAFADTPLYTRPPPAIPATVTDEDVERAQMILLERGGYVVLKADMRAALESFANKETTDE